MKVPLTNTDPWAEVAQMLIEANPGLDFSKIRPYKIAAGTGRNTRLFLVGSSAAGVAGKLYVEYDRLNASGLFSKFGDLTKHRPMRLYGLPGTTVKISDILRQLNDMLGVQLTMTGDFRDIAEGSFVMPAKSTSIVIDILPHVSASGDLPVNLRMAPATKLSLNVVNGGAILKDLNKALNPFVKSNGNINWALADRPLDTPTPARDLILYNRDFSEFFGNTGLIRNVGINANPVVLPGSQYGYSFRDDIVDQLNTIFATLGLPPFVKRAVHFVHKAATLANIDVSGTVTQGRGWVWTESARFITVSEYDRALPANINPAFARIFKVIPPSYPANTTIDDLPINDNKPESQRFMYLHFNLL